MVWGYWFYDSDRLMMKSWTIRRSLNNAPVIILHNLKICLIEPNVVVHLRKDDRQFCNSKSCTELAKDDRWARRRKNTMSESKQPIRGIKRSREIQGASSPRSSCRVFTPAISRISRSGLSAQSSPRSYEYTYAALESCILLSPSCLKRLLSMIS